MGAAEIGRLLGVSRQRVQQLVKTPGFPAPVAVLDMGKIWQTDHVIAWADARAPRTPTPTTAGSQHAPDRPVRNGR